MAADLDSYFQWGHHEGGVHSGPHAGSCSHHFLTQVFVSFNDPSTRATGPAGRTLSSDRSLLLSRPCPPPCLLLQRRQPLGQVEGCMALKDLPQVQRPSSRSPPSCDLMRPKSERTCEARRLVSPITRLLSQEITSILLLFRTENFKDF